MYKQIDLSEVPKVSISTQNDKKEQKQKYEKGEIVYIGVPFDLKISVIVESHKNGFIRGEIMSVGGIVVDNLASKFPKLSINDKVEIKHKDFA